MAERVCPWWLGYVLANPLRRLLENPDKLLGDLISPGMTVLDIGCAMGFFTLPAAQMVGPTGHVVAVDIQPKMIGALMRRAQRRGLADRIETRLASEQGLGIDDLTGRVDLAMAIHVVHEVPDRDLLMTQVYRAVKPGGRFLLVEPKGHVSEQDFAETVAAAERAGFKQVEGALSRRGHSRLFGRG